MTSLKEIGEFGLINRIRSVFKSTSKGLLLGIGDDCAVIKQDSRNVSLISADLLVEGVHFDLSFITPFELGMKSAAVNISDIAAMGGAPKYILVSLAIPERISIEFIKEFYSGLKKLSLKYGVELIGGDTSLSKNDLFINISIIGEAKDGEFLARGGARAGDAIYITGNIGDSSAGLDILLSKRDVSEDIRKPLVKKHLNVTPRVKEGAFLAKSKMVTAMMDLSDGIGSDMRRICEESKVGAEICLKALPISKELKKFSKEANNNPYDFAISGGEDYELLFTVKKECQNALEREYKKQFNKRLFQIGVVTRGKEAFLIDGNGGKKPLTTGYNHFKKSG